MRPLYRTVVAPVLFLASTLGLLSGATAAAQSRISDKDVEHLMENLREDAKRFQDPFKDALGKSSIRKTSQERDARELAKRFERQTDGMLQDFKRTHKGDAAFATVSSTAQQLDGIVLHLGPGSRAAGPWAKVQSDLSALAPAFNVPVARGPAVLPSAAPPETGTAASFGGY